MFYIVTIVNTQTLRDTTTLRASTLKWNPNLKKGRPTMHSSKYMVIYCIF